MKSLQVLKSVLNESVNRRGEKPLTNVYLLNLVNMAIRAEAVRADRAEKQLNESLGEDAKWGSD